MLNLCTMSNSPRFGAVEVMRQGLETGQPLPAGAQSAPPTSSDEITKLLETAPRYGIEIRLSGH